MRPEHSFSLKIWIPLLIAGTFVTVFSAMAWYSYQHLKEDLISVSLRLVTHDLTFLQREMDKEFRRGFVAEAGQALSARGVDTQYKTLVALGEQGQIRHATHIELIGRQASKILADFDLKRFAKTRENHRADIHYDPNLLRVIAYFPLELPQGKGEIRSSRIGVLFAVYDLSDRQAQLWNQTWRSSLPVWLFLFLVTITVGILLLRFVVRPIQNLSVIAKAVAEGEFGVRCEAKGAGEIAHLGRTFNDMSRQLESRFLNQQLAEVALRGSEAKYRSIFQSVVGTIVVIDEKGMVTEWNAGAEKTFGYTAEEVVGKPLTMIIPERFREGHLNGFAQAVKNQGLSSSGVTHELAGLGKGGREFPLELTLGSWKKDNALYFSAIILDISKRKQAEEARATHLCFLEHMERINSVIHQNTDVEQMMSDVLQSMLGIFRADRAWLLYPCDPDADSWSVPMERTRPEYPGAFALGEELPMQPEVRRALRQALERDDVVIVDYRTPSTAKQTAERFSIYSEMHIVIRPQIGKPWLMGLHQCSYYREWNSVEEHLFREIAHRVGDGLRTLLFLRDLEKSQEQWRSLTESSPDHIMLLDKEYRVQFMNHTLPELAMEQLIGESALDFVHPDYRDMAMDCFNQVMETGELGHYETEYITDDKKRQYFDVRVAPLHDGSGNVTGLISTSVDMTQQRDLEKVRRRSQKMEAIGQLTGGIAHDFNNILGIILGNLELLEQLRPLDTQVEKRLASIKNSARRAASLTKQLLGFSRQQVMQTSVVNINQLIKDMSNLISHSVTPQVLVEQQFDEDAWLTEIDPGDFQDALLNLVINARDAMPRGGKLILETSNHVLDATQCDSRAGEIPGEYVLLTVSDSGEGMSADMQEHIFDPFYSTKPLGKGTGLGLAMVYGFVKRSGGNIKVYSELGTGTTFRLYLPRTQGQAQHIETTYEKPMVLPRGTETILVVDDEIGLLTVAKASLQALGYRVLTAESGERALELLDKQPTIDMLFSDVVMPGDIDGYRLGKLATTQYPDLKVLLTSGYTEKAIASSDHESFKAKLLSKPYSQAELALQVRALLGSPGSKVLDDTKPEGLNVAPVEWSNAFDIGVEAIDKDHQGLLALYNRCLSAIQSDDSRGEVGAILAELMEYSKTHFRREEAVMAACAYPGLNNHCQVHRLLVKQIVKMQEQLEQDELSVEILASFLNNWLIDHIQSMDQAFVPYLEDKIDLVKRALEQIESTNQEES